MSDTRFWRKETLEEFLSLYRSFPSLWKIKSSEYKNKHLKNAAYEKLVQFCKDNICPESNKDFVIKKIQGLRGAFRKELRKVVESKRSGAREEEIYKPTLWYFHLLTFTKDQSELSESNSSNNTYEWEDDISNIKTAEESGSEGERSMEETEKVHVTTLQPESILPHSSRDDYVSPVPKTAKRKNSAADHYPECLKFCQASLEKSFSDTSEYEAVGINVAKKLERMNPAQAIYAEDLIHKILRKGLLRTLNENTDVHDHPYHAVSIAPSDTQTSSSTCEQSHFLDV